MPSNRVSNIENRSAAIAMASAETITFESHPGWTLQARFFRDVKNAEEVGNLIVAGKLPVKTSVINAKLVPGERELRRNRKEGKRTKGREFDTRWVQVFPKEQDPPAAAARARDPFLKNKAPLPLSPAPSSGLTPGLGCPRSFVGAGPQTCFRFTRRATRPSAPTSPRRD